MIQLDHDSRGIYHWDLASREYLGTPNFPSSSSDSVVKDFCKISTGIFENKTYSFSLEVEDR